MFVARRASLSFQPGSKEEGPALSGRSGEGSPSAPWATEVQGAAPLHPTHVNVKSSNSLSQRFSAPDDALGGHLGTFEQSLIQAAPRPSKSESLRAGTRRWCFQKLPRWFWGAAKFENLWFSGPAQTLTSIGAAWDAVK